MPPPTDPAELISVSIIGAGRLGTSLGKALRTIGHDMQAVSCSTPESAEESRRIIGGGRALTDNLSAASGSRLVFLSVPDDALPGVVEELASSREDRSGACFLHTSGLLTSRILKPLVDQGAHTGSFHPMQSFADKHTPPEHFSGIYFGIEGDVEALALAKIIIMGLNGHPLALNPEDKALVHTACSIVSNLFVPLLHQAGALLEATRITPPPGLKILLPLAQGTLQNVKKLDSSCALTGPIARGDLYTIESQLKVLGDHPDALRIYRELGKAALDMARKEGNVPREILARISDLLEDR